MYFREYNGENNIQKRKGNQYRNLIVQEMVIYTHHDGPHVTDQVA